MSFLTVWNAVWPYLIAVLCFLVLIVIHEFGHFIAAKAVGIRVNEFAVGFGPKLFAKKGKETTYRLNLIPFGGYCAMEGEDDSSEDPRAFCNQKPWKRLIVVLMGAIFNLILGLIIVAVILSQQSALTSRTVAWFADDAVSSQTGLQLDDTIVEVNGRHIYTFYELSYAFSGVPEDGKLDMTVLRNGEKVKLTGVTFRTQEEQGIRYVDLDFKVYGVKKTFGNFLSQTFRMTFSYCRVIWFSLLDLLGGKYGISAVSGPVGITATIGNLAKQNLLNLLPVMALITVNLGLFNLLPLPALDGGRALFLVAEMICRRPIAKKQEGLIHAIGFAILIGLSVLIMFKDIWTLITG